MSAGARRARGAGRRAGRRRKLLRSTTAALDGLTLTVPEGSVFGFLGPNGAGKTTTLRILAGLARADAGAVRVLGHDVGGAGRRRARSDRLPARRARLLQVDDGGPVPALRRQPLRPRAAPPSRRGSPRCSSSPACAGVETRIGGYSRGMKQRLGVAQALVNAPRLLLLDEPTSALDPIGRREVLDMIAALRGRTTVFFSTHILADVERVCDTVAIIDQRPRRRAGRASTSCARRRGGLHRLRRRGGRPAAPGGGARRACPGCARIEPAPDGGLRLSVDDLEAAQRELPALVARLGLALRRLESDELSLEDVFVDLWKGSRP